MKIILSGICGFMGREVIKQAQKGVRGAEIVFGIDINANGPVEGIPTATSFDCECPAADCVVDFSNHVCTPQLTQFAIKHGLTLILATTGQTPEERQMILDAAKQIPVFWAANFSLGVALLIELAKKAAQMMPEAEIEIVETHHDRKLDAPSGTALAIAKAVQEVREGSEITCGRSGQCKRKPNEIGIQSLRYGNIAGIHEVYIATNSQTIMLKHEAHDRSLFAEGAMAAAEFMVKDGQKPAGLYDMNSVLKG